MLFRKVRMYTYIYIPNLDLDDWGGGGLASLDRLEKWFPFQGERAHSLLLFFIHVNRKEEEEGGVKTTTVYQRL